MLAADNRFGDQVMREPKAGGPMVMRKPKAGGPVEELASGQDGAQGIALDTTHVYWTNYFGDQVMRLSRCACDL